MNIHLTGDSPLFLSVTFGKHYSILCLETVLLESKCIGGGGLAQCGGDTELWRWGSLAADPAKGLQNKPEYVCA